MSISQYTTPPASPPFDLLRAEDILNEIRAKSHNSAYKLCVYLDTEKNKGGFSHKIATAESLTGGLIFSTLVDIPFFGYLKYGCFSVYDTDAKRVMLGVNVKDVYTQKCAKEMAEGILRNSNATIGIAVSGNAMATNADKNRIGELFIGISTYLTNKQIITKTYAINTCNGKAYNQCKLWYKTIENELNLKDVLNEAKIAIPSHITGYNDFILTSFISNYIRAKTTHLAFVNALNFLKSVKKNKAFNIGKLQEDINRARIETDNYEENDPRMDKSGCQSKPLYDYKSKLTAICDDNDCNSIREIGKTAEFNQHKYLSDSSTRSNSRKPSKKQANSL